MSNNFMNTKSGVKTHDEDPSQQSTGRKDFGLVHLSTVCMDGLFSHTERTRERFESQSRKRVNFHTPIRFNCPINQYELHQSCWVNY